MQMQFNFFLKTVFSLLLRLRHELTNQLHFVCLYHLTEHRARNVT